MRVSVVAAAREDDRPPREALSIAAMADRLGYDEVWLGEGPTWDAFALATAVGLGTEQIEITAGPVPVSLRDPVTIVRGAASAAALTGRVVGVALGTSSVRVVEGLHGRSRAGASAALAESARVVRALLDGEQPWPGAGSAHSFPRRLGGPGGALTVAAFGDRAIAVAAEHADRMLLDLVSPEQVRTLRDKLEAAASRTGRPRPALAAWLPAAVDPDPASHRQLMQGIAGYLTVRGYSEMFISAGLGEAVRLARDGAGARELVDALPEHAPGIVGLVGDADAVRGRMEAYVAAGLDEVALVPATAGDPGGEHTLTALADLA